MSTSRRSFTAEFKREAVQMIHKQGLSVSDSPRVHAELLVQGHRCNRKTVAR